MAYKQDEADIPALLKELDRLANNTSSRLTAAVSDVDKIIDILTQAREQIADCVLIRPQPSQLQYDEELTFANSPRSPYRKPHPRQTTKPSIRGLRCHQ